MGGKKDGQRVNTIEEYYVNENRFEKKIILLTSSKSGFGCINYLN